MGFQGGEPVNMLTAGVTAEGQRQIARGFAALGRQGTPVKSTVDAEDVAILKALAQAAPRLLTQYDIAESARVSRKTVGKHLKRLRQLRLAVQQSPKSGHAITDTGTTLLNALPKKYT